MKAAFLASVLISLTVLAADQVQIEYDLSAWVSHALRNSPDINISRANLETAEAGLLSARSFLWPSLNFNASAGHYWSSSILSTTGLPVEHDDETYSTSLTLSQEILSHGGSAWLRLSSSRHEMAATGFDCSQKTLDITLSVLKGYYGVVEAMELKESAVRSLERSRRQLEKTTALYDLGASTTLELIQAQVQESRDRLTLSQRDQALNAAHYQLYQAAGITPCDTVYTVRKTGILEPVSEQTALGYDLDLSHNPSLLASRERLEEAELSSEADKRLYWPSLSASGSWSWSDKRFDPGDIPDEDSWNVSVSLSWNIFDGWYRESRIQSSRASFLRSRAGLESLEINLLTGVAVYREELLISIRNYELARLSHDYAVEQLTLSQMSYDLGGISLLDLLDAQKTLAEAEASLVTARVNALQAEADLLTLLGRTPRLGE